MMDTRIISYSIDGATGGGWWVVPSKVMADMLMSADDPQTVLERNAIPSDALHDMSDFMVMGRSDGLSLAFKVDDLLFTVPTDTINVLRSEVAKAHHRGNEADFAILGMIAGGKDVTDEAEGE